MHSIGKTVALLVFLVIILGFHKIQSPTPYPFPELLFFPKMPTNIENPVTIEGAELGRYLFYDSILSADGKLSCASCHRQEAAFSDAPNILSRGRNGVLTTRNTMPLFNLAWYPSLFWDGRASSIEELVFHPVRDSNELNLPWKDAVAKLNKSSFYRKKFNAVFGNTKIDSTLVSKAIGQYLRTLLSYQSKFDLVLKGQAQLTEEEYEGFILVNDMTKGDCLHCHTTDADALGTIRTFSNNGLDSIYPPNRFKDKGLGGYNGKSQDEGKFKIPSLRNLAFTAPYMHDGRFSTLEAVLDFYSEGIRHSTTIDSKMGFAHQGGARLSAIEKKKIIAFLLTLSDSSFVNNPRFSNPYGEISRQH